MRLSDRRRPGLRGDSFGCVFQQFNLLAGRTVLEKVAAPQLHARGRHFWSRHRIAAEMLDRVGLADRLEEPAGEAVRQRAAAHCHRPGAGPPARVILADEPTGALDVVRLSDDIAGESGTVPVAITHDLAVAARARRHHRLADGTLAPVELMAPDRTGPYPNG